MVNINNKGFTIIELIIVLAIIAITSGTIMLNIQSSDRTTLQLAKNTLIDDIRFAQNMAKSIGTSYYISFNSSLALSNTYHIRRNNQGRRVLCPVSPGATLDNDIILRNNFGGNTINFTSRGTVAGAGTITMQLRRYSVTLTVNLGSGRVTSQYGIQRTNS